MIRTHPNIHSSQPPASQHPSAATTPSPSPHVQQKAAPPTHAPTFPSSQSPSTSSSYPPLSPHDANDEQMQESQQDENNSLLANTSFTDALSLSQDRALFPSSQIDKLPLPPLPARTRHLEQDELGGSQSPPKKVTTDFNSSPLQPLASAAASESAAAALSMIMSPPPTAPSSPFPAPPIFPSGGTGIDPSRDPFAPCSPPSSSSSSDSSHSTTENGPTHTTTSSTKDVSKSSSSSSSSSSRGSGIGAGGNSVYNKASSLCHGSMKALREQLLKLPSNHALFCQYVFLVSALTPQLPEAQRVAQLGLEQWKKDKKKEEDGEDENEAETQNCDLAELLCAAQFLQMTDRRFELELQGLLTTIGKEADSSAVFTLEDGDRYGLVQMLESQELPQWHYCAACYKYLDQDLDNCNCDSGSPTHFSLPDYKALTNGVVYAMVFCWMGLEEVTCTDGKVRLKEWLTLALSYEKRSQQYVGYEKLIQQLGKEEGWKVFLDEAFFVTHVIFIASKYGREDISVTPLGVASIGSYNAELHYIENNMQHAIKQRNWEVVGEFISCLFIMGYDTTKRSLPSLQQGLNFLLSDKFKIDFGDHLQQQMHTHWCVAMALCRLPIASAYPIQIPSSTTNSTTLQLPAVEGQSAFTLVIPTEYLRMSTRELLIKFTLGEVAEEKNADQDQSEVGDREEISKRKVEQYLSVFNRLKSRNEMCQALVCIRILYEAACSGDPSINDMQRLLLRIEDPNKLKTSFAKLKVKWMLACAILGNDQVFHFFSESKRWSWAMYQRVLGINTATTPYVACIVSMQIQLEARKFVSPLDLERSTFDQRFEQIRVLLKYAKLNKNLAGAAADGWAAGEAIVTESYNNIISDIRDIANSKFHITAAVDPTAATAATAAAKPKPATAAKKPKPATGAAGVPARESLPRNAKAKLKSAPSDDPSQKKREKPFYEASAPKRTKASSSKKKPTATASGKGEEEEEEEEVESEEEEKTSSKAKPKANGKDGKQKKKKPEGEPMEGKEGSGEGGEQQADEESMEGEAGSAAEGGEQPADEESMEDSPTSQPMETDSPKEAATNSDCGSAAGAPRTPRGQSGKSSGKPPPRPPPLPPPPIDTADEAELSSSPRSDQSTPTDDVSSPVSPAVAQEYGAGHMADIVHRTQAAFREMEQDMVFNLSELSADLLEQKCMGMKEYLHQLFLVPEFMDQIHFAMPQSADDLQGVEQMIRHARADLCEANSPLCYHPAFVRRHYDLLGLVYLSRIAASATTSTSSTSSSSSTATVEFKVTELGEGRDNETKEAYRNNGKIWITFPSVRLKNVTAGTKHLHFPADEWIDNSVWAHLMIEKMHEWDETEWMVDGRRQIGSIPYRLLLQYKCHMMIHFQKPASMIRVQAASLRSHLLGSAHAVYSYGPANMAVAYNHASPAFAMERFQFFATGLAGVDSAYPRTNEKEKDDPLSPFSLTQKQLKQIDKGKKRDKCFEIVKLVPPHQMLDANSAVLQQPIHARNVCKPCILRDSQVGPNCPLEIEVSTYERLRKIREYIQDDPKRFNKYDRSMWSEELTDPHRLLAMIYQFVQNQFYEGQYLDTQMYERMLGLIAGCEAVLISMQGGWNSNQLHLVHHIRDVLQQQRLQGSESEKHLIRDCNSRTTGCWKRSQRMHYDEQLKSLRFDGVRVCEVAWEVYDREIQCFVLHEQQAFHTQQLYQQQLTDIANPSCLFHFSSSHALSASQTCPAGAFEGVPMESVERFYNEDVLNQYSVTETHTTIRGVIEPQSMAGNSGLSKKRHHSFYVHDVARKIADSKAEEQKANKEALMKRVRKASALDPVGLLQFARVSEGVTVPSFYINCVHPQAQITNPHATAETVIHAESNRCAAENIQLLPHPAIPSLHQHLFGPVPTDTAAADADDVKAITSESVEVHIAASKFIAEQCERTGVVQEHRAVGWSSQDNFQSIVNLLKAAGMKEAASQTFVLGIVGSSYGVMALALAMLFRCHVVAVEKDLRKHHIACRALESLSDDKKWAPIASHIVYLYQGDIATQQEAIFECDGLVLCDTKWSPFVRHVALAAHSPRSRSNHRLQFIVPGLRTQQQVEETYGDVLLPSDCYELMRESDSPASGSGSSSSSSDSPSSAASLVYMKLKPGRRALSVTVDEEKKQSDIDDGVIVKRSCWGLGLYAERALKKGNKVVPIRGFSIFKEDGQWGSKELPADEKAAVKRFMIAITDDCASLPCNRGRFVNGMNEEKDANCVFLLNANAPLPEAENQLDIFHYLKLTRDVKAGEQLIAKYNPVLRSVVEEESASPNTSQGSIDQDPLYQEPKKSKKTTNTTVAPAQRRSGRIRKEQQ